MKYFNYNNIYNSANEMPYDVWRRIVGGDIKKS